MKLIQKLIEDKMKEGKSRSRIAEEAKVSKTAIHNYYHSAAKPEGKSLSLLSKYFNVPIEDLLEQVRPASSLDDGKEGERRKAMELQLLIEELAPLSPTEQLEWLLKIRKSKEEKGRA